TVTATFSWPSPSTLMRPSRFFTRPSSVNFSKVSSFSPSSASRSRFTTAYSVRKMLVKPRFGMRRCSGIWPPSKPRIRLDPDRDPCPLCPRPEVFPVPDPMPRPTRFLFRFAFFGARKLDKFISVLAQRRTESHRPTRFSGSCEYSQLSTTHYSQLLTTTHNSQLIHNPHQMRNRLHHPPNRNRVFPHHNLIQPREPQPLDHPLVLHRSLNLR